jgi:aspartyl-tRNA(Asn)/glutamyl-tRNA(Gln) amidotransferase subunit A
VSARGHAVFTPLFNHAKVPALSLPCGRGRDNLPVGLQIIARRGRDRLVLAFAAQAEAVLGSIGSRAAG